MARGSVRSFYIYEKEINFDMEINEMKKNVIRFLIALSFVILSACGPSVSQLKMIEPENGKCIVAGAILVENNGVDDFYVAHKSKIIVVIVGKSTINGEESIEGYRIKTDENGYFFLPNVPQGAYVIKGIELSLGYGGQTLITSRWDGARQIYHPAAHMIDYVVRSWPEEVSKCVNDLGINYFMIDPSMGIYSNTYSHLTDNVLALKDLTHTMSYPAVYYQEKYPGIECLKK
jgi:hypothetical protein